MPSPRSSVAGTQLGCRSRVSLTSRVGTSPTRSSWSMRVNPMAALTFFIRLTAITRGIWSGSSGPRGISVTISPLELSCRANRLGFCR